jgi:hypothetical protein
VKELRGEGKTPSTGISGERANLILEKIVAGGANLIVQDS